MVPRSTGWRLGHVGMAILIGWGLIPLVMWVPPHIPWILGAFSVGLYFAIRFARERYTLLELEGICPSCSTPQRIAKPLRLGIPHRIHCPSCQQQLLLRVELQGNEAERLEG